MPSIKGIWRWKDAIDFSSVSGYITQDVNFTSNGESFRAIEIRPTLLFYYSSVSSGSEQIAVGDGTSVQDAYKQIDFGDTAQTVSDEFYAVFSANADSTEFIIQMGAVYPVKLLTKGCYLDKNIRILPPPIDEPIFEERTVTPTAQTQEVTPGVGYDALSKVIVNAVPTETKSVTPTEQEQIIRGSEGSFLSSVSVKAIQASEKTVTENGEYTPTSGTYYKKVTVNVPQYTDVSATTAQADDVLQGKSFYPYNGSPLTEGTIPVQTPSNPEFTRKTDTATFPKGYYSSESTVKIADTEQAKIIPENIKKDTVILGVTGSYAGVDVSDTTATQGDVLSGKYFYGADGMKTEGTIPVHTETSIILNAGTGDQYVPAGHYSDILTKLVLNPDAASKIKQGEVILGVTGSYAGGGAALAHTATFTVDGSNYAIHSVTDGQPIVSPISPSKTGYAFKGWTDSNGNTISFPYTMSASEETLAASFISAYYMTIGGLGNSSPTSQSYVSSGATFPTSFEEVTKDGDIFIKIPTMYRKVNAVSSNQITSFTISNVKEDDTYLPYPCFVRPDGSVMDYILIGKYLISSSSAANSVNASNVALTPAQGIALCKNKGAGYYPYDVWTQKLFQDLELAIGKKVNYQDGSAAITVSKIGLNHLDKAHWVLGVIGSSGSWYACYDPDKYQALEATDSPIPQDYVQIGYVQPTTDNEIQKLGYDESNPFFNYPTAVVSNSSFNTYYCDGYYYDSGNRPVASNVGFSAAGRGLWVCYASDSWSLASGVRLCYRPL